MTPNDPTPPPDDSDQPSELTPLDESFPTAEDQLKEYREKRDFGLTAEPAGGDVSPHAEKPFFCVQKHAASRLHYDVRLEVHGVLKSWAVPKGPSPDPTERRLAVMVEDHPLEYGDFEGTIPEGEYGGGTVLLWDIGWWEPDLARRKQVRPAHPDAAAAEIVTPDPLPDPEADLASGELKFILHGEKLRGSWTLVQMKGRGEKNWLMIKHRDDDAHPGLNLTQEAPLSVSSSRSIEEIAEDASSGAG